MAYRKFGLRGLRHIVRASILSMFRWIRQYMGVSTIRLYLPYSALCSLRGRGFSPFIWQG